MRPKVLILVEWYLPGYKAGGLVTATLNVIESLGETFEFFVITRDRDLTDERPYPHTRCDEWVSVSQAKVLYTADFSFRHLRRRILEIAPDMVYLNSFFSVLTVKTLTLRWLGLLPCCPFVVAVHGEFSPGALKLKRWKKWPYSNLALRGGLYGDVVWHATSELEREHIAAMLRAAGRLKHSRVLLASNAPNLALLRQFDRSAKPPKLSGAAKFLFLSRISPKKNLSFALEMLAKLIGRVECDICGPADDQAHWQECQQQIAALPGNVTARYHGAIPPESILQFATGCHFLLLPTLGENFGYVILEAMAAGCPVVLSDRTPWNDLQPRSAGWSLPLEDREQWRQVLQQCVDMDQETYQTFSLQARQYFERWVSTNGARDEMIELFHSALARKAPASVPRDLAESAEAPR
jgi:glycosyltransferase involved in cell wall biosynthesis